MTDTSSTSFKNFECIAEIIAIETEHFKMAVAQVHETRDQYSLWEKDLSPETWNNLRPALQNLQGIIKGTGTTVRLIIQPEGQALRSVKTCDIIAQPPARDLQKVHEGDVARFRLFLDGPPGREGDTVILVSDDDQSAYRVEPSLVPKRIFNGLKGMTIDLSKTPVTNGMRDANIDRVWVPGTGTRVTFTTTFDNVACNIFILSQPKDHPDDYPVLSGKLTILAKDGAILEHPLTGDTYELPIHAASDEFWAKARVLYGDDTDGYRVGPANLIPVYFKRTAYDRRAYDPQIIEAAAPALAADFKAASLWARAVTTIKNIIPGLNNGPK